MLRWLVVVLIAVQFMMHARMRDAFHDGLAQGDMYVTPYVVLHFCNGVLILLVLARCLWIRRSQPEISYEQASPLARLAGVARGISEATLLLLPIAGAVAWAAPSVKTGQIHQALAIMLLIVLPPALILEALVRRQRP